MRENSNFHKSTGLVYGFFHQPDSNFNSKNWRSGDFRDLRDDKIYSVQF